MKEYVLQHGTNIRGYCKKEVTGKNAMVLKKKNILYSHTSVKTNKKNYSPMLTSNSENVKLSQEVMKHSMSFTLHDFHHHSR